MTTRITLWRELFAEHPRILLKNSDFTVTAFRYASGVEGLKIENSRGHLVILPWMGQMIWDAQFDGHDLTMRNMFSQPKPAAEVVLAGQRARTGACYPSGGGAGAGHPGR